MLYKEDVVHIYIGILLTIKKNKLMPFAATWMDLEIITISKSEKLIVYDILICGI